MSISVDDLVASFSSNHIGQEAMDLAALQAQLAQVLFHPSAAATSSHRRNGANTPISRTPTSTFAFERAEFERRRSNSVASMSGRRDFEEQQYEPVEAMEDDERMVEDLLFPSSPAASNATPAQYSQATPASPTHFAMHSRKSSLSTSYSGMHFDIPSSNHSTFASSDPFYLAQLQAMQTPAPSFFSQYSMPSQQSPFLKAHQFQAAHGHPFSHHSEAQSATAFVR